MKYFFLFLLFSFQAWSQDCPGVNPKKVILFIDTNQSDMEIATARRAACIRGEKLEVVPSNYKEYKPYIDKVSQLIRQYDHCNLPGKGCEEVTSKLSQANLEMNAFKDKQKDISQQIKEKLKEISNNKAEVVNLTISGHNGGSHFGGEKGDTSLDKLRTLFAAQKDVNSVKSVMLLGCYAGNQNGVMEWKGLFPQANVIAGYDGSAPLSDKPLGHDYIFEVLTNEKKLVSINNGKNVDAQVKHMIDSLDGLLAGIYVDPACSDVDKDKGYYYGSRQGRKFKKVDVSDCEIALYELKAVAPTLARYNSGDLAVPADTAQGELRQIYNKFRTFEHCLKDSGLSFNANHVFNLLFNEGVKQNFAKFYEDDMKKAKAILDGINPADVLKNLDVFIQKESMKFVMQEKNLADFKKNSKNGVADLENDIEEIQDMLKEVGVTDSLLKKAFTGNGKMTEREYELFTVNRDLFYDIDDLDRMKKNIKTDPDSYIRHVKEKKGRHLSNLTAYITQSLKIKKDPNYFKKIWVPDTANIKSHSRKALLDNIHKMNEMLSVPGITEKQSKAMRWVAKTTNKHLVDFANPFGWHEYTGKPDKPTEVTTLAEALK